MPGTAAATIFSVVRYSFAVMLVYEHPASRCVSMSRNYYSEINLHLTWHCKESAPMLSAEVEPVAYRIIKDRIIKTPDVIVHEIGGTDTHIHIAVTVPPSLIVSTFVGQLKGASSHNVNQHFAGAAK